MKLNEVGRRTQGKAVLAALHRAGACLSALDWTRDHIQQHPKTTAQGLWNACPKYPWMSWLAWAIECQDQDVIEASYDILNEMDGLGEKAYSRECNKLPGNRYNHTANEFAQVKAAAAKAVRDAYKSPWLP